MTEAVAKSVITNTIGVIKLSRIVNARERRKLGEMLIRGWITGDLSASAEIATCHFLQ